MGGATMMTRTLTRRTVVRSLCASVVLGANMRGAYAPRVAATAGTTLYDIGTAKNYLTDVTAAPDGAAWFHGGSTNEIGRITLNGEVTDAPNAIVAAPDGGIWFTEYSGHQIGRLAPDGTIAEYSFAPDNYFGNLAVGLDSSIWFRESMSKNVGRITPDGTISHFSAAPPPSAFTVGPDGNLWFTTGSSETAGAALGFITPTGVVSSIPVSIPVTGTIVYGPGNAFWIAADNLRTGGGHYYSDIYRVTPTGMVTSLGLSGNYYARSGITVGADGNVWAGIYGATGDRIARITPTNQITEYTVPDTGIFVLTKIAASPDGDILFSQRNARDGWGRIGRLDPTKAIPTPETPEFTGTPQ